ncbi:ATP-binding cassette domain-containing protein [Mycoplasma marinum]|uniref:AAA+ ATPase domain-containing protein n=1 Tax=Mycoplasma marinum TaxID=1937190 RepID=A0A4R0XQE4_9MOLU|nr:ATP-binding cassette domain-containing protein [Mycoplasma marinum]TCG10560.1 hypothetical protein C4B24_04470 [Mycoplasma marinum]
MSFKKTMVLWYFLSLESLKNKKNIFFCFIVPTASLIFLGLTQDQRIFSYAFPAILSLIGISIGTMNSVDILMNFKKGKLESVFLSYKVSRKSSFIAFLLSSIFIFILFSIILILISLIFFIGQYWYYLLIILLPVIIMIFTFVISIVVLNSIRLSSKTKNIVLNIIFLIFLVFSGSTIPSYILIDKLGTFYRYLGFFFPPVGFANLCSLIISNIKNIDVWIYITTILFETILLIIIAFVFYNKNNRIKINENNFYFKNDSFIWDINKIKINNKVIIGKNNLEINIGDKVRLIGENGAGKTIFMDSFLEKISKKNNVSYISQEFYSILTLNIGQIIKMFLILNKINNKDDEKINKKTVKNILDKFSIYSVIKKKYSDLSSGEQQKIKMIIAFIQKSNIWFLDEPMTSLDEENKNILLEKLNGASKEVIILLITHAKQEFPKFKKLVLIKGEICQQQ